MHHFPSFLGLRETWVRGIRTYNFFHHFVDETRCTARGNEEEEEEEEEAGASKREGMLKRRIREGYREGKCEGIDEGRL